MAVAVAALSAAGFSAGFTPGNVVALRVGETTNTTTLTANATVCFLDEYNPVSSNTLVQRIDLTYGTPNLFTVLGTAANFDGTIHVSNDNQYIIIGGYNCAPGTATPHLNDASVTPRIFARVKISDGSLDTSVKITTSAVTGVIRAATSPNGIDFYAGMYQTVSPNTSSVYYTNASMAGNATDILIPPSVFHSASPTYSVRDVLTYNNQLYFASGNLSAGRINGLYSIGTGFPTSANTNITTVCAGLYAASPTPGFFTAAMVQTAIESYTPNVAGGRFFSADSATARCLTKYTYDGSVWTQTGLFGGFTLQGIGCALGKSPSNTDVVFYSQATGNPNNRIYMVDRNTAAVSDVAQASTTSGVVYTLLRGLAFIPAATAHVDGWTLY